MSAHDSLQNEVFWEDWMLEYLWINPRVLIIIRHVHEPLVRSHRVTKTLRRLAAEDLVLCGKVVIL
jgi:hypothetical protein